MQNNYKKILILSNNLKCGGLQNYCYSLINYLQNIDINYNITLMLENTNDIFYNINKNIIIIKYDINLNNLNNLNNYDFCFLNSFPIINELNIFKNILEILKNKCKKLYSIIHSEYNNFTYMTADLINYFDTIIGISYKVIKKIKKYVNKNIKYILLPPSIDINNTNNLNDKLNYKIGYYGRIEENKGIELLIKYWEKIYKNYPLWKLIIFGFTTPQSDVWFNNLIKYINKNIYLKNSIIINKNLYTDNTNIFKKIDILISLSFGEGLPYTILESLNNNVPVLTTKLGGIPEVIIPEFNGDIFNFSELHINKLKEKPNFKIMYKNDIFEKNFKIFKNIIIKYLNNDKLIIKMKYNCKKILVNFTREKIITSIKELLNNNINKQNIISIIEIKLSNNSFNSLKSSNDIIKYYNFTTDYKIINNIIDINIDKLINSINQINKSDIVICNNCLIGSFWFSNNLNSYQKLYLIFNDTDLNNLIINYINYNNVTKILFTTKINNKMIENSNIINSEIKKYLLQYL